MDGAPTKLPIKCTCGKEANHLCHEVWAAPGLVPCNGPICANGCTGHRHQPGTMGYPGQLKGATTWYRYEADGPGLWNWLKALWATLFWSAQRKADKAWAEQLAYFPPPAPYPFLQLVVGFRRFESRGEKMVEVEQWSEPPRPF